LAYHLESSWNKLFGIQLNDLNSTLRRQTKGVNTNIPLGSARLTGKNETRIARFLTTRWCVGAADEAAQEGFASAGFDAEDGAEGAAHERLQRAFPPTYVHRPAPGHEKNEEEM
jgi:hypothetical protein